MAAILAAAMPFRLKCILASAWSVAMKPMTPVFAVFLSLAFAGAAHGEAGSVTTVTPMSSVFQGGPRFDFPPPMPGAYELPVIKEAAGGKVLNHNGQRRELKEILNGSISILSFVYLTCSDAEGCPLVLSNFFEIYHRSALLPRLRDNVQLITVSFDPARDTVAAINAFHAPISADQDRSDKIRWIVLTTENENRIKPILDGYSQAVTRNNSSDVINHLVRIYLIDKSGKIRNVYGLGTLDPRLLITDIETLLLKASLR